MPPRAASTAPTLRWPGKHRHHGGNAQVIATPDGWPIWVSPVRPGREHDTTRARHHGLAEARNRIAIELDMPTLADLGYENAGDGFRHPRKKPAGGELTEAQQTYNKVTHGIHGVREHANSLLRTTSKALRRAASTPAASPRSPPRPLSCSNSTTTASSKQSLTVVIHYWERLSSCGVAT